MRGSFSFGALKNLERGGWPSARQPVDAVRLRHLAGVYCLDSRDHRPFVLEFPASTGQPVPATSQALLVRRVRSRDTHQNHFRISRTRQEKSFCVVNFHGIPHPGWRLNFSRSCVICANRYANRDQFWPKITYISVKSPLSAFRFQIRFVMLRPRRAPMVTPVPR